MMSPRSRIIVLLSILLQALFFSGPRTSHARHLTGVLLQGFSFEIGGINQIVSTQTTAPSFSDFLSAEIAQAVAQEVPLASVAPAFTYRYNPAVDIFQRQTNIPGPLFSERALTIGKGQFNFSVGSSFFNFSELNGTHLHNIRSPGLILELLTEESTPVEHPPPGVEVRPGERLSSAPLFASLLRTRISLEANVISPTLRYGITDAWEVGLSVPIVNTFLKVRNELIPVVDLTSARFLLLLDAQGVPVEFLGFFDTAGNTLAPKSLPFLKSRRSRTLLSAARGSATGVGDIVLHSKYHLWQNGQGGAAVGLNLQLPSGETRDFQGTGETHLSTFLYLSQVLWERVEPHLNLGIDLNTSDMNRNSFLYAVGATWLLWAKLGVVVDFLGRNEFGRFRVPKLPQSQIRGFILDRKPDSCTTAQPCFFDPEKFVSFTVFPPPIKIGREDKVNFTVGLRYTLGTRSSVFFGAVIPLNNDGLRPDFIPSGGIEYTF
jgi:hypothetical protein